jgi:hypothetical protein
VCVKLSQWHHREPSWFSLWCGDLLTQTTWPRWWVCGLAVHFSYSQAANRIEDASRNSGDSLVPQPKARVPWPWEVLIWGARAALCSLSSPIRP